MALANKIDYFVTFMYKWCRRNPAHDFLILKALLILPVDFRSRRSLSAGGSGASSSLYSCGVSLNSLFPQESRAFRSNHHWVKINIKL
jgi:hypothetical protein